MGILNHKVFLHEKLKKIFTTGKFPDLQYLCPCAISSCLARVYQVNLRVIVDILLLQSSNASLSDHLCLTVGTKGGCKSTAFYGSQASSMFFTCQLVSFFEVCWICELFTVICPNFLQGAILKLLQPCYGYTCICLTYNTVIFTPHDTK